MDCQIGTVSVGDTDIFISGKNGQVFATINNHSIVSVSKDDNLVETLSPILAQVVTKIHESKTQGDNLVSFSKGTGYELNTGSHGFVNKVIYYLNKKIGKIDFVSRNTANVKVALKSDTISIALNPKAIVASLENYKTQIETVSRYLGRTVDLSNILTRRKLISTMHGSDTTQKVLNSIRDNVSKLASEALNLPAWTSISTKSKLKLAHRLEKNLLENENERIYASTVLIPNITDHYDKIKNFTIKMAVAVSPLIYIDDVFKANTKFPATWFLPTNNIEDLNESYGVVLSFLLNVPDIEANLIDPLNFLRVQNLFKDKK